MRRYFVDATHPVWGQQVLNYRWLMKGHRFFVGVGGGRKRLNILGGWCPEDYDYVDLRLSKPKENVNAQTFIDFMTLLHQRHPKTKKFILYLDNARYFHAVMAREWIEQMKDRGVTFVLEFLPAYSPNLNLIERLWKFLKGKALCTWHQSFEAMQESVAGVLDDLQSYHEELRTLMTEKFQIWPEEAWNKLSP